MYCELHGKLGFGSLDEKGLAADPSELNTQAGLHWETTPPRPVHPDDNLDEEQDEDLDEEQNVVRDDDLDVHPDEIQNEDQYDGQDKDRDDGKEVSEDFAS